MTKVELREILEDELLWRFEEINFFKSQLVNLNKDEDKKKYRKSMVLILYSHLEGFIKAALLYYAQYLNGLGKQRNEFDFNLIATSMNAEFKAYDNKNFKSTLFNNKKVPSDSEIHSLYRRVKELVFNKEMYAKEVPHIQSLVENHYWLFGEQYNLITAAEPDFTLALRGLILATTGKDEDVDIDHEDKNKEMDIFMIRQDRKGNVTENVVVELKRPTVPLGEMQLSQVKKYLQVIRKDDRFNMGNVKWTFYLVGNKFNSSGFLEGELENNRNHGEQHLVYWVDNGMTKIYVLKWSEIFDEFSKRHEYLLEKLKLEETLWMKQHDSADEVVQDVNSNSAVLEQALIPKKSK